MQGPPLWSRTVAASSPWNDSSLRRPWGDRCWASWQYTRSLLRGDRSPLIANEILRRFTSVAYGYAVDWVPGCVVRVGVFLHVFAVLFVREQGDTNNRVACWQLRKQQPVFFHLAQSASTQQIHSERLKIECKYNLYIRITRGPPLNRSHFLFAIFITINVYFQLLTHLQKHAHMRRNYVL